MAVVTLQQLKCFCVLAEVLHYTKASEVLHISQPTLSYSVAELQKKLGVPLFERQKGRPVLTKFGEAFLPYAENVLVSIADGKKALGQMLDVVSGMVSLGYIYSISSDFLPKVISDFQKQSGNANISFQFYQGIKEHVLKKLEDGTLDLAIASFPGAGTIGSFPLFTQELFLVVPRDHPLAQRDEVSLSDVREEPFIIAQPDSGLRDFTDSLFKRTRITPKVAYEVEECNAMVAFVSSKQGIAIMPKIPLLGSNEVSVLKVSEPPLFREINLLWKSGKQLSFPAERFKSFVMKTEITVPPICH
jgi:DNA-binding transcriptional LysR family regulator